MPIVIIIVIVIGLLVATPKQLGVDCTDPVNSWHIDCGGDGQDPNG